MSARTLSRSGRRAPGGFDGLRGLSELLTRRPAAGGLRAYLARGTAGAFALRIAATGLGLLTSAVLARLLGATGYGAYAYALALVGLLGVPATSGLPPLVTRSTAAYQTRAAWGLLRGILGWATRVALVASAGLAALAALAVWFLADRLPAGGPTLFWLALLLLPLTALNMLRSAVLQGMRRVVLAQLPEGLIRPGLFVALIAAAHLALGGDGLTATHAMALQVAAAAVACVVGLRLMASRLPTAVGGAPPAYDRRAWTRSALPLLLVGGMYVVNNQTGIIVLGALKGPEAAGVYRVAVQGAMLVTFGLMAANAALAPVIAGLHAAGEAERLQRAVTVSARMVLLWSLPVALVMILFGRWLLSTLFGEEFAPGATALAILSAAQLLSAGMGSVGVLLNMSGHERDTARGVAAAAAVNVALNALLIPGWGIEGAATATATSLVVWNVLLALRVHRRLGLHATALGKIGSRAGA